MKSMIFFLADYHVENLKTFQRKRKTKSQFLYIVFEEYDAQIFLVGSLVRGPNIM